MYHNSLIVARQ